MVSRSVLKLDKGKNADCLVTISPEQQHAFLFPNIEDSTFHHPPGVGWSPSLSREENVSHAFVNQLLHSYPLQEEDNWYPGQY